MLAWLLTGLALLLAAGSAWMGVPGGAALASEVRDTDRMLQVAVHVRAAAEQALVEQRFADPALASHRSCVSPETCPGQLPGLIAQALPEAGLAAAAPLARPRLPVADAATVALLSHCAALPGWGVAGNAQRWCAEPGRAGFPVLLLGLGEQDARGVNWARLARATLAVRDGLDVAPADAPATQTLFAAHAAQAALAGVPAVGAAQFKVLVVPLRLAP